MSAVVVELRPGCRLPGPAAITTSVGPSDLARLERIIRFGEKLTEALEVAGLRVREVGDRFVIVPAEAPEPAQDVPEWPREEALCRHCGATGFEEDAACEFCGATGRDEDAAEGMAWWNSISRPERARWLKRAGSAAPADAWRAFKMGESLP